LCDDTGYNGLRNKNDLLKAGGEAQARVFHQAVHMHLCADMAQHGLRALLSRYGLDLVEVAPGQPIPGSYWGESEAGIIGRRVYARADTPVHSLLHEACHVICMDGGRRERLHTDAGGDFAEEDAVCYLQLVLADHLEDIGWEALCADMDAWGYTFRLGSACAWFLHDAEDARSWLVREGLLMATGGPIWRLRR
jgi:hypothetical protein